mmetsp:Transcript_21739/g.66985  ORF Transcript_21739/g.66985 Transcript_21739/m.66985 type:complete len:144 (+) Transcript_21739:214-645(+)
MRWRRRRKTRRCAVAALEESGARKTAKCRRPGERAGRTWRFALGAERRRSGSQPWTQTAKLTAFGDFDNSELDLFGHSVDVSGSSVVVGAPHDEEFSDLIYDIDDSPMPSPAPMAARRGRLRPSASWSQVFSTRQNRIKSASP